MRLAAAGSCLVFGSCARLLRCELEVELDRERDFEREFRRERERERECSDAAARSALALGSAAGAAAGLSRTGGGGLSIATWVRTDPRAPSNSPSCGDMGEGTPSANGADAIAAFDTGRMEGICKTS